MLIRVEFFQTTEVIYNRKATYFENKMDKKTKVCKNVYFVSFIGVNTYKHMFSRILINF